MRTLINGRLHGLTRTGAAIGVGAATVVLAAACASSGSSSSTPATGVSASSAAGGSGSGATTITTATASGTTFLTDGSGKAVYLWVKDSGGQSACSGACASAWPPVMATGTVTASGSAQASDLGSITRSDGVKQVTYNGHPLYYFVGDSGAGQATGQGSDNFGAKWWLVSPAGSDVTASVTSFTPGSSGSAGGTPAPNPTTSTSKAGGGWS